MSSFCIIDPGNWDQTVAGDESDTIVTINYFFQAQLLRKRDTRRIMMFIPCSGPCSCCAQEAVSMVGTKSDTYHCESYEHKGPIGAFNDVEKPNPSSNTVCKLAYMPT